MRGQDSSELVPTSLALIPLLGLSACVVPLRGGMDAATSPDQLRASEPESGWIEPVVERQPLTLLESAVLAGEHSMAAGQYEAAREMFSVAAGIDPDRAQLRLAQVDALIAMGEYDAARSELFDLRFAVANAEHDRRLVRMRELEHAFGFASCDVQIDATPRPLAHHDDSLSAWNDLRGGLPTHLEIPIPADTGDAEAILCGSDCDEPNLVRLEAEDGATEASLGLAIMHDDGGVSVLADVLHPAWDSCSDDTMVSIERHGHFVRVRAFTDERQEFDPSDWELPASAGLGSMAQQAGSSGYYAGSAAGSGSSGYQGSGYQGSGSGSSGYQGSGYQGSGYAYYGCGGGYDDYDYDDYGPYYCTATRSVQRDLFIDLRRGEVVLDIVRTGPTSSPLGEVGFASGQVSVAACGIDESLPLSWTEA